MCIAIYKPEDVVISKRTLKHAWHANPHGAGFAWRTYGGNIEISKGHMTFRKLWRTIQKVGQEHDMAIHFRWATHGENGEGNTHPFPLGRHQQGAMIHNGIFSGIEFQEPIRSDTAIMAEDIISPMINYRTTLNDALRSQIDHAFGLTNKGVILLPKDMHIIGEQNGIWDKDIWYSNSDYAGAKTYWRTTTYRNGYPYQWYDDDDWQDATPDTNNGYIQLSEREQKAARLWGLNPNKMTEEDLEELLDLMETTEAEEAGRIFEQPQQLNFDDQLNRHWSYTG